MAADTVSSLANAGLQAVTSSMKETSMAHVAPPRRSGRIALALALAVGASVTAHHSQSAYEPTKTITIEGTLERLSWSNPHSLFFVQARPTDKPTDAIQRWSVEGPNPRALETAGWMKTDAKIGEKISMTGRPRRDGRPDMLVVAVTTSAGKSINFRNDGTN
jgi:hypothetical protein